MALSRTEIGVGLAVAVAIALAIAWAMMRARAAAADAVLVPVGGGAPTALPRAGKGDQPGDAQRRRELEDALR